MLKALKQTADKNFFMKLTAIALPSVLQSLLNSSRNIVDTVMIGRLGVTEIAAVGAAGKPFFVSLIILLSIAGGAGIMASQHWGQKNIQGVKKYTYMAVLTSFMVILPVFLLFQLFPDLIINITTSNNEIIEAGSSYLSILSFNLLFQSVTQPLYSALRSMNHSFKCTINSTVGVCMNIILNYLFIFGHGGFPEMGLKGAALASMISALTEMILVLIIMKKYRILNIPAKGEKLINRSEFTSFLKLALPIAVNGCIWAGGLYIYSIIYGHMGNTELAVMTMLAPMEWFSVAFYSGLATGAAVLLGHRLGKKEFSEAWRESWVYLLISLILGILLFTFFYLSEDLIFHLYRTMDNHTLGTGRDVYTIFLILLSIKAINVVVIVGVLRSGGDTRFILFLDTGCLWLVGIPLAWLGAFYWNLPLNWVFTLILSEEFVKIFFCLKRMYSRAWIKNLIESITPHSQEKS